MAGVVQAPDPVDPPVFAEIEVREVGGEVDGPVVPNEVRINGISFYTSADHPVRLEPIEISGAGDQLVLVTMTFVARRVVVEPVSEGRDRSSQPVHRSGGAR